MPENTTIWSKKSGDLYQRLRNSDITKVMKAYDDAKASTPDARLNLIPTLHNDTILHMAIYMGQPNIAEEIIQRCCSGDKDDVALITKRNDFGNTALHEAAATDNIILVEKLLEKAPALLSTKNKKGEMPLYAAAYFGQTNIFESLAEKIKSEDLHSHMCSIDDSSRPKEVRSTVLHAAVHSEFFELALKIAKNQDYEEIINLKDRKLRTSLQLLSSKPSAFKSGTKYGPIKSFIYSCAPSENAKEEDDHEQNSSNDSSAENSSRATLFLRPVMSFLRRVISSVNRSVWIVLRAWSPMRKIYKEKKKHRSALELAKLLIAEDVSWSNRQGHDRDISTAVGTDPDDGKGGQDIPLFLATIHGIFEIVEETLRVKPLSFEYTNKKWQNILHLAIMHRRSHIFDKVTDMETLKSRLVRQIDKNGYTILHHVGNMEFYNGGTQPGPALQLQEELEWFEKVEKFVPPHYAMIRSKNEEKKTRQEIFHEKYVKIIEQLTENEDKIIIPPPDHGSCETPKDYFRRTHGELLKEAQEWLKQTSESCSTVAGLMATVAFAAAFTVPGGNDEKNGQPILLSNPFFLVFIITDALSLASSLTSLVMFLSILTSPFELDDFRRSLPRKLILGFTFLFFSVAVTMLAFASTLMLTIPIKKRFMTSLVYCVAFLPVTLFALLQFPLYVAFKRSLEYSCTAMHSLLPRHDQISTAFSKAIKKTHRC